MIDFTTPSARRAEVLGATALIVLVLGFTIWYMATHQAPTPYMAESETATTTPAALPPEVFEERGQYYDIEATYPAETALKASLDEEADEEALSIMGDFVEDTIDEFKTQGSFDTLTAEDAAFMGLTEDRKESIQIAYEEKLGGNTVSYVFTLFVTRSARTRTRSTAPSPSTLPLERSSPSATCSLPVATT